MKFMSRLLLVAALISIVTVTGCITPGYSREGTIEKISEPAKSNRARASDRFNSATKLLVKALDTETGKINDSEVEKALAAYREAEKLNPNDPQIQKQLGIIYEFFKSDEKAAYVCYKRYKKLRGSDPEILSAVEEFAQKYENGGK